MAVERLTDSVYTTGVIDPCIRKIDSLATPYGTTYNSYFIFDRTCALIDPVVSDFAQESTDNLSQIADIGDINFLILTDFDSRQSDTVKNIVNNSPHVTVVCTHKAKEKIEKAIKAEMVFHTVKKGETLNLGNNILKFITDDNASAMAVYHKNNKIIFTGKLFSSHYCEPRVTDENIRYMTEYVQCFTDYANNCVLTENITSVYKGIMAEDFQTIAPINGAVIVKHIAERTKEYAQAFAIKK